MSENAHDDMQGNVQEYIVSGAKFIVRNTYVYEVVHVHIHNHLGLIFLWFSAILRYIYF